MRKIESNGMLLAIVVKRDYSPGETSFITPPDATQQLGYIYRSKGGIIAPHIHNRVHREINTTSEVILIKKGRLKVDIYTAINEKLTEEVLEEGDLIIFYAGGHGFEALEDCILLEVKQGPYAGEEDKTRF